MGSSVQNYIIAARTAQGFEEWKSSTEQERLDIISRWHAVQLKLNSGKSRKVKDEETSSTGFAKTRHMSFDERKMYAEEKKRKKQKNGAKLVSQGSWLSRSSSGTDQAHHEQGDSGTSEAHPELEEAIQRSVTATSRGDPREDRLIERAIRASVAELQRASQEGDEEEALNRAVQASVAEAAQGRGSPTSDRRKGTGEIDDHNEVLEAALHRSLLDQHLHNDDHDSGIETDEDDSIREAIELSKQNTIPDAAPAPEEDLELQKAIDESKQEHSLHQEDTARALTEEEIVLEYVKKQSLVEQEHKRQHGSKGKSNEGYQSGSESDDELKHAIEESLRVSGKAGESSTGPP